MNFHSIHSLERGPHIKAHHQKPEKARQHIKIIEIFEKSANPTNFENFWHHFKNDVIRNVEN
jgi:hypothetical protein